MGIDALTRLRYAIVATRYGGGAAKAAATLRLEGIDALDRAFGRLTNEEAAETDLVADRLLARGIDALLLGDDGYPASLAASRVAPAALFVSGSLPLLDRSGLGICGSRNASEEGLRAARACGEAVAARDLNVVSGYARGIDMAAHSSALAAGGTTIIVLADGIEHFRVRRGEFADLWDPTRAVVVSQFSPAQPWSTGAAMSRNKVISALSEVMLVVEAGDTGGTLAAGQHALDRGQPLIVLELSGGAPGNRILRNRGATVIRSRRDLDRRLGALSAIESAQPSLI
jgi:DNA processing protein